MKKDIIKMAGFLLGAVYLPLAMLAPRPYVDIIQITGFVFALLILGSSFAPRIGEWCRTGLGTLYYKTRDIKRPPEALRWFAGGFLVGIPLLFCLPEIVKIFSYLSLAFHIAQ